MSGRKLILSPGELTVTDDRNGQGADDHAVSLVPAQRSDGAGVCTSVRKVATGLAQTAGSA